MVPETQNLISMTLQRFRATPILFHTICMLATINFHDEPAFHTAEIHDEAADRMLTAEFHPIELPCTKMQPELALGIGLSAPQLLRAMMVVGPSFHESSPLTLALSPEGRGNRIWS